MPFLDIPSPHHDLPVNPILLNDEARVSSTDNTFEGISMPHQDSYLGGWAFKIKPTFNIEEIFFDSTGQRLLEVL